MTHEDEIIYMHIGMRMANIEMDKQLIDLFILMNRDIKGKQGKFSIRDAAKIIVHIENKYSDTGTDVPHEMD